VSPDDYAAAVDATCQDAAGADDLWNVRFVAGLFKRGLVLLAVDGPPAKPHYVEAPVPFSRGEPTWSRCWIVEADIIWTCKVTGAHDRHCFICGERGCRRAPAAYLPAA